MSEDRCRNMNHGRSNVTIKHCPSCGEVVNSKATARCDDSSHAARRKDRANFCSDCGKKLR